MRIKYNIKNSNSFKVFNDSMGIALNRENIIRGKKVKYLSYLTVSLLELLIVIIFLGLMLLLNSSYPCTFSFVLIIVATLLFIYMMINILYPFLFATCFVLKEENELEINEKGVSFYFDDDSCYTLGWTHIRALAVGKYSINFLTDDSYYFYLDRKYQADVIKAIKEYNKSLLIIK